MATRLATVTAVNEAYQALAAGVQVWEARSLAGVPANLVLESLSRVNTYNRTRLLKTFQSALGVDVRRYLSDAGVRELMQQRVADNVSLIRTIPARTHEGLRSRITEEFLDKPFDREALTKVVRAEGKSQGYNLRRIVRRTESSKLNGQLVKQRQGQLAVTHYVWQTSDHVPVRLVLTVTATARLTHGGTWVQ